MTIAREQCTTNHHLVETFGDSDLYLRVNGMIGKNGDMIPPPRVAAMIPPLDIFWVDSYGNVRWFEHAGDFDAAKARLKALGIAIPGRYVVFSEKTGHRTVFNVDKRGELSDVTGNKPLGG